MDYSLMRLAKYNPDQVQREMALLDLHWKILPTEEIKRRFEFKGFKVALLFVQEVGKIAEELHHHPDIYIGFNRVEIKISTHDVNGLTELDFLLAREVDALFEGNFH